MEFTVTELIAIFQLVGIPILLGIWFSVKKVHRGNKLNGFKITALVHAMQLESQNGFTDSYEKKLSDLIKDANFIEDK